MINNREKRKRSSVPVLAATALVLAGLLFRGGRPSPAYADLDTGVRTAGIEAAAAPAAAKKNAPEATPAPTPEPVPEPVLEIDGVEVDRSAGKLDWSGHSLTALAGQAEDLPALKRIELGRTTATAEELQALQDAFPDARLSYTVMFRGRPYDSSLKTVDLAGIPDTQVKNAIRLLDRLPELKTVNLLNEDGEPAVSVEIFRELYTAHPELRYEYHFDFYGHEISLDTVSLEFLRENIGDDGIAELRELLPLLPELKELRVDRCKTTDEVMAQLRDDFPEIKVVWRVYFGPYTCMTDAERIWITAYLGYLCDENSEALKYCTSCKYLDIGHNNVSDISFVRYMPELEVAIFSMNRLINDISPLADCPKLEYLELTLLTMTDLSPLSGLENLRHLELSQIECIDDITPLYGLNLERLHIMYNFSHIPDEQLEEFQALHPDCICNFTNGWEMNPYVCSHWRYEADGSMNTRYALLREQIGYDDPYAPAMLYDYDY